MAAKSNSGALTVAGRKDQAGHADMKAAGEDYFLHELRREERCFAGSGAAC